jgi:hypothetical protein
MTTEKSIPRFEWTKITLPVPVQHVFFESIDKL